MRYIPALIMLTLAVSCAVQQDVTKPKPGINDRFLAADLDVEEVVGTFESESREIFVHRKEIVSRLELTPGMAVADVGAGTGLFLDLLAGEVGPEGKVYAVDVSPKLVDYMGERARAEGLPQVETVLCSERSAELADASVDLVFVCDTYHHFEFPEATLASLHSALRPGGRLQIVDFHRIPGVSREWIVDHVRAGKESVISEIEAAGFIFESEINVAGLTENYMLRFRRP